jgi:hypothetical protein
MKKLLLILFCLPLLGIGQNSLFKHDLSNSIVATKDPSKTIGIKLNSLIEDKILLDHPKEIFVNIPFFNNIDLAVTLSRLDITDKFLTVISKNLEGEDFLEMQPSIVSYKIMYKENSIGIMNFYNGIINSSFKIDNHQYEISIFNNQYILFEASNSINTSNFSCQVEEELSKVNNNPVAGNSFLPVCIEFALEIDLYTRQTFNSDLEATNWALAIFAGVSQLYEAQTNASISVQSIYIWNITDPYAAYINDAGNMLNALASHWQNNNGGIARDLVHLLSKRNNTGTGGIAWLDVLCSTSYGYAFSSYLNNDTTYSFPNPSYTWNLMVCAHEVGHNVGSPHTHSCNWVADPTYGFTGGGIDDCGVSSGSSSACIPAAPAPPGGFGTIMSYCHVGGSGIVLNFHNIVISQALNPGIANAICLSICSTDGCTDPSAYNYVPSAVTDDGSCCYTAGCTDPNALNYDSVACYDDGSCTYPIYGCTDTSAINYDSTAAVDDGSCCYNDNWATLTMMDSYGDGWNGNYFVMTNVMTGTVVFYSTCVGYLTIESGCLPDGCYDITVDGGTWQSEISWNLDDGTGVITSGFAPYTGQIAVGAGSCLYPPANFCDDFESYTNGSWLAASSSDWTTWTQPYNSSEDAQITNSLSSSPSNSLYLFSGATQGTQDVILPFGSGAPYTNGYFNFSSKFYVNPATGAYFNFQAENTPGLTWSLDVKMDLGTIVLENTGSGINFLTATYPEGVWFELKIVVDLTTNNWELFIDNQNLGSFTNTVNKISSLDLYPLVGHQFYVDDVCYEYSATPIISGCTDFTACNYNPAANIDDGSCLTDYGCTDPLATNYDASATCDDNSCVYCVYGCTDSVSVNYSASATCDDGSCIASVYGCTDPLALNYYAGANIDNGSCCYVSGCMDPIYVEYDALACIDDGSCLTPVSNTCTNPSPTGAYVTELIHDRVRVNWDNMNSSSCIVDQYRINYREQGTATWSSKTMGSPVGSCNFGTLKVDKLILNLNTSTAYEYQMKAWYCGGGVSTWSALQNFTTADECENLINFAVSTPTTTKASFTWDSTGAYSFARIKLRVDTTGGIWTSAGGFGVFYPALSKEKNGLIAGTSYRAQARTWCDPTGGAYRSATWTPLVFWTQPTSIRLEGGTAIANLFIYPNPSRDVFNISFTSETKQNLKVRILNVIGEELINDKLEQFIGEYTKQINLSENAKGIYFLEIETNDGVINKNLILQ